MKKQKSIKYDTSRLKKKELNELDYEDSCMTKEFNFDSGKLEEGEHAIASYARKLEILLKERMNRFLEDLDRYILSKYRSEGQELMEAVHNIKQENGVLKSTLFRNNVEIILYEDLKSKEVSTNRADEARNRIKNFVNSSQSIFEKYLSTIEDNLEYVKDSKSQEKLLKEYLSKSYMFDFHKDRMSKILGEEVSSDEFKFIFKEYKDNVFSSAIVFRDIEENVYLNKNEKSSVAEIGTLIKNRFWNLALSSAMNRLTKRAKEMKNISLGKER